MVASINSPHMRARTRGGVVRSALGPPAELWLDVSKNAWGYREFSALLLSRADVRG